MVTTRALRLVQVLRTLRASPVTSGVAPGLTCLVAQPVNRPDGGKVESSLTLTSKVDKHEQAPDRPRRRTWRRRRPAFAASHAAAAPAKKEEMKKEEKKEMKKEMKKDAKPAAAAASAAPAKK